jgi:hypothetical protein
MEREPIPPPSKERRWDIDERGDGVSDAAVPATRIEELQRHAERPRWIAEQPEIHLWPHLERAIHADGSAWVGAGHSTDPDGRFVVDLVHERMSGDRVRATLQADVLALLGLVVESATFIEIEERASDDPLVVDVVTGVLDDQSPFKAHGHTIRFRVTTVR